MGCASSPSSEAGPSRYRNRRRCDGSNDQSTNAADTLVHVFPDDGVFAVQVTALDNDGVYIAEQTVTVNNVPPTLTVDGSPLTMDEGDFFTLDFGASDPGDDRIPGL